MNGQLPELCNHEGCRRLSGHTGGHDPRPTEAWGFFDEKDKTKLLKAGWATPRGGDKGGYQNHVDRSNRVIVPYERMADVDLSLYQRGYMIRLFPQQYFVRPGQPRDEFRQPNAPVQVGQNAFLLYRTPDDLRKFPPLPGWRPRSLTRNGQEITDRRGDFQESGEYILRFAPLRRAGNRVGPPQGIFATEYADPDTNYLCKCVLAWLIIQTAGSPYTLTQAQHLRAILHQAGLDDANAYEQRGALRHGLSCCPLCTRFLRYSELHQAITFSGEDGLANASMQVEGATRSTIVNLFHLSPLVYHSLTHVPQNIAWGHAICNTRLGQRKCYSLAELIAADRKVGIVREEGIETFGWISEDWQMIRSPNGAVWIQLNGDVEEGPPASPGVFDVAVDAPSPTGDE